jgi:uncharacterized protein
MRTVFLDTSGIIAAINRRDFYHNRAKEIFHRLSEERCVLVITNYIRLEAHSLLLQRAGKTLAMQFLNEKSWLVEWVTPEDERKAINLLQKFADKSFSLTDASSFIVMERLRIGEVVSFDRHFSQYGWNVLY